ncbi:mediator complex subunit Srb4 [Schizosaccharomyces japonicus yFS275]|uniref:Mediator of RNA polymerase II transcription subunit 17 n=1 Tax=Schizosaccharomyces japonicus (strain yFS275 / FY16936) TaxID=402676 RepID=B6JWX9_SCHJY|nr:mediator complex subunit Srb4 [Schizosaccharomyces japonicus yFS275]EEB05880.1 mediator complex subunit Srb4 [Schizosaccharomyces japonicus yFS275]
MAETSEKNDDFLLPIDPEALQDSLLAVDSENSLATVIPKIVKKYGLFRSLTESDLREKSEQEEQSQEVQEKAKPTPAKQPTAEEQGLDNLSAHKKELIDQIAMAQNECSLALDMVSLLLSKYRTNSVDTISPFLENAVSLGSLTMNRCEAPKAKSSDALVGKLWKDKALKNARTSFTAAAQRLRNVVEGEQEKWNLFARFHEKGWPILRGKDGALCVQYSALGGQSVGVGTFDLSSKKGKPTFVHGLQYEHASLKVDIHRRDEIVASNRWSWPDEHKTEEDDVEKQLHQARRTLFEMDVWNALLLEAQYCGNQGVIYTGNSIEVTYDGTYKTSISLSPVDSGADEHHKNDLSSDSMNVDDKDVQLRELCLVFNTLIHVLFVQYCRETQKFSLKHLRQNPIPASILRPLIFLFSTNRLAHSFQTWLQEHNIPFTYEAEYPWTKAKSLEELERALMNPKVRILWKLKCKEYYEPACIEQTPVMQGTEKFIWKWQDACASLKFQDMSNLCQYIEYYLAEKNH